MLRLTEKQVEEIATDLEAGLQVAVHRITGKIKTITESGNWFEGSEEYSDDISDYDLDEYWEFEQMSSRDSFTIMEDFARTVDDQELRERLYNSLDKPKPFKNFKLQIDYSGDYRQKWFDFKTGRFIRFVKRQLQEFNSRDLDLD